MSQTGNECLDSGSTLGPKLGTDVTENGLPDFGEGKSKGMEIRMNVLALVCLLAISGPAVADPHAVLAVVLLLAYALALLLGSLAGVVALAKLGLSRFRTDAPVKLWLAWSAIAIVSIVIGAAYVVRPLGMVVGTLVMLLGVGALALNAYSSFRVSRA